MTGAGAGDLACTVAGVACVAEGAGCSLFVGMVAAAAAGAGGAGGAGTGTITATGAGAACVTGFGGTTGLDEEPRTAVLTGVGSGAGPAEGARLVLGCVGSCSGDGVGSRLVFVGEDPDAGLTGFT